MNWYKKYFENRRHFKCPECGQYFSLTFWDWLWAPHMDTWRYRWVRCPHCGIAHWLQAERMVK